MPLQLRLSGIQEILDESHQDTIDQEVGKHPHRLKFQQRLQPLPQGYLQNTGQVLIESGCKSLNKYHSDKIAQVHPTLSTFSQNLAAQLPWLGSRLRSLRYRPVIVTIVDEELDHQDIQAHEDGVAKEDALRAVNVLRQLLLVQIRRV